MIKFSQFLENKQQIFKLKKVIPREGLNGAITAFQLANNLKDSRGGKVTLNPANGNVYFEISPNEFTKRGQKWIKLIFRQVLPGNPVTMSRPILADMFVPEDMLSIDLAQPEVTFINPIIEYD